MPAAKYARRLTDLADVFGTPLDTYVLAWNAANDRAEWGAPSGGGGEIDAGNITTGTLDDARLSGNVALLDGTNSFSGLTAFANGSAATPSVRFINGTTSGLYWTGTALGLSVGGTNRTIWSTVAATFNTPILANSGLTVAANQTLTVRSALLCNDNTASGFYAVSDGSGVWSLGFFGVAPATQPIVSGTAVSDISSAAEVIDTIREALVGLGLVSSS
jgi:hypothetical protein